MKPTNPGGVAGLRAAFMSILICGLAGCGTTTDRSPSVAELLEQLETVGAREAECPGYLPDAAPGKLSTRRCFRVRATGAEFVRSIAQALPAEPGEDLSQSLRWDLVDRADLGDGCSAELLNNVRPYGYRSTDGRRGWLVFWVVDRTGCDEETLVAMTNWVPTPSNP